MLLLHAESHLDHGLTDGQRHHLLERFRDREGFFIETFELPPELGEVPCALYGPIMGDPPVPDSDVAIVRRGDRKWLSRTLVPSVAKALGAPRMVRTVTVIAGPHDGQPCVLYTAFGGPLSPKEVGELELEWQKLVEEIPRTTEVVAKMDAVRAKLRDESQPFWKDHALAIG